MSVDAILQAVEALSSEDRDALFDRLDEKYGSQELPFAVTPELLEFLEERNAEYEANPNDVVTVDEAIERIKSKRRT